MNNFTKEELQYFLMCIKPFHWLWRHDPLELENKIQSMIDNYCSHEHLDFVGDVHGYYCKQCDNQITSKYVSEDRHERIINGDDYDHK